MQKISIARIQTPAETAANVATYKQDAMLLGYLTQCTENASVIQGRVPERIKAMLPSLVADAHAALRPAQPNDVGPAMTRTLTILGGVMGQEDRTAWQVAAGVEFMDLPGDLVLAGLEDARRNCRRISEVVFWVFDYSKRTTQRRRERLDSLLKLAELAALPAIAS